MYNVLTVASFRDVGISLAIDGSEDHLMHFQGQPLSTVGVPGGVDLIKLKKLLSSYCK